MTAIGTRVLAISSAKDGKVRVFGKGVYVGDKIMPVGTRSCIGVISEGDEITNPCIHLDDGGVVWGAQCWWGELEAAEERFNGCELETVPVPELAGGKRD